MSMFDILNLAPDAEEEQETQEPTEEPTNESIEETVEPDESLQEEPTEEASEEADTEPPADNSNSYEYIPEEFRPKEFANAEEELKFYKENYGKPWEHISSEAFQTQFLEKYEEHLTKQEKDIENFKGLYQSFKTDPKAFIAANMPEYAEQMGLQKTYTDEEIDTLANDKLAEEFGEDWKEQFDQSDLINRTSLSSKILRRRQEIEREYDDANAKAAQARSEFASTLGKPQNTGADPEALKAEIEKQYKELFEPEGFSKEDYQKLVDTAREFNPTMKDIYHMTNYETLVEAQRKEAHEEGRQSILQQLQKAGKISKEEYQLASENSEEAPPSKMFGLDI